jgi:hypothetical protein
MSEYHIKFLGPAILATYGLLAAMGKSAAVEQTLPLAAIAVALSLGQAACLLGAAANKPKGITSRSNDHWYGGSVVFLVATWVFFGVMLLKAFSFWPFRA